MQAFVTGATGFLGSHVARILAEQGASLRLLVRASSNLKNIHGLKAETVVGDLRDSASLDKAMDEWSQKEWMNGSVALIIRDGKIVYYKAAGYNDLETKAPMQKDAIFRIASEAATRTSPSASLSSLTREGSVDIAAGPQSPSSRAPVARAPKLPWRSSSSSRLMMKR